MIQFEILIAILPSEKIKRRRFRSIDCKALREMNQLSRKLLFFFLLTMVPSLGFATDLLSQRLYIFQIPPPTPEQLPTHFDRGLARLNRHFVGTGHPFSSPKDSTRSLREALVRGVQFDDGIINVHQMVADETSAAARSAGLVDSIRKAHPNKTVPLVSLASYIFRIAEPSLLERTSLVQYSDGGELNFPYRVKNLHVFGGFFNYCVSTAIRDILNRGLSQRQVVTIYTDYVYFGDGRFLTEFAANYLSVGAKIDFGFNVDSTRVPNGISQLNRMGFSSVDDAKIDGAYPIESVGIILSGLFGLTSAQFVREDLDEAKATLVFVGTHPRTPQVEIRLVMCRDGSCR